MDYTIIDAHAHLWLRQDTVVDGFPIRTLENGRSLFMGEIRQMVPPFMIDGVNSAEVFSVQYGLCPSLGCGYYTRIYRRHSERLSDGGCFTLSGPFLCLRNV